MKNILQIIFLLQISIILTQDEDEKTLSQCLKNNKCLINGPTQICKGDSSSITSYDQIENLFTDNVKGYKLTNINQIQCGTELEKCASIDPGDIDDECTNFPVGDLSCCYIKLKYKYNTKYGCYPIKKDKKTIKEKIKEMKQYYIGIKKISIYCNESFVKFNFYSLIFGFLILI